MASEKNWSESPLARQAAELLHEYDRAMSRSEVNGAISRLVQFATTCNTYIEMTAPWQLAKDPSHSDALDHVLFVLVESLRVTGVLISAILPTAAREIFWQLNLTKCYKLSDANWGACPITSFRQTSASSRGLNPDLGSACVSRAGFSVAPKQASPYDAKLSLVGLRKVRDREDAFASTRDARAPQTSAFARFTARILRRPRVHRADARELRRRNAASP
jgi:hypothetical protein